METLLYDLRYALRTLIRQKGFAATAIVTLALAIGSTTAIFSVVNAVVLQPLSYAEPDRLVTVMNLWTRTGLRNATVSAPDFQDWRDQSQSFDAIAFYSGGEASVATEGAADYATVIRVSPGFFRALGARPQRGRLLTPEEEQPGGRLSW